MDSSCHESAGETPEPAGEELSPAANTRIGSGELHPGAAKVRAEILHQLRAPFQRMLADYLGCAPTVAAIQKFADKSPDRWVQGLVMLGQMAGYTKDVHVSADVSVSVRGMSDVEVRERLVKARETLGQLAQSAQLQVPAAASSSSMSALPLPLPTRQAFSAETSPHSTTTTATTTTVPRETLHSHSPRAGTDHGTSHSDIIDIHCPRINDEPNKP